METEQQKPVVNIMDAWSIHPLYIGLLYGAGSGYAYAIGSPVRLLIDLSPWERITVTRVPKFVTTLLRFAENNPSIFYSKVGGVQHVGMIWALAAVSWGYEGRAGFELLQWLYEKSLPDMIALLLELYETTTTPIEVWEYFRQIHVRLHREGDFSYYVRYPSLTNTSEVAAYNVICNLIKEKYR